MVFALSDPASPEFHHWLTPEGYAARFGTSAADVARVSAWLASQGFEVLGPSRTSTRFFFSGTVHQLEQALRTEVHYYDVRGERHFALGVAPSVPSELAELISGVRGVHDFRPEAHPIIHPDYLPDSGKGTESIAPSDWATIYDVTPLYERGVPIDGTGQQIAIAGQSEDPPGRHPRVPQAVRPVGDGAGDGRSCRTAGSPGSPTRGNQMESTLDCEWSGAVAKNATVNFVYTGNNKNYSVYDAAAYAIDQAIAPVLSFSFGWLRARLRAERGSITSA